jgi:hypothetical protein
MQACSIAGVGAVVLGIMICNLTYRKPPYLVDERVEGPTVWGGSGGGVQLLVLRTLDMVRSSRDLVGGIVACSMLR